MTRFRAYQLGSIGSSFSYFNGTKFTLIEGRFNEDNAQSIYAELRTCSRNRIDCLHISSWDDDHCAPSEISNLLTTLKPWQFELPSYDPLTGSGLMSLSIIKNYVQQMAMNGLGVECKAVNTSFLSSLSPITKFTDNDVFFNTGTSAFDNSNDKSTVKFFRSSGFSVLSLGDVENPRIAENLLNDDLLKTEVDVMILAHHGADNGFTTGEFLSAIRPAIAICSSNHSNEFNHPKPEIRNLLSAHQIPLMTTKNGDIIIESGISGNFTALNLITNSTKIDDSKTFKSKRQQHQDWFVSLLSRNQIAQQNFGLGNWK